jgi:hypothetical protein
MAARKQLWHPDEVRGTYVYRIFNRHETVYVGKGSGRRLETQTRKFGCDGEILEVCKSDDHAFRREIHWIALLRPSANILRGGNGGRRKPRKSARRSRDMIEIDRVGSRRYAARFLLTKLDERNCASLGLSKVDVSRLREVANGPRC